MKIRVLIADDELLARLRIRQLLTSEPDFEVIGEHESGHEAACFIREHHPELVSALDRDDTEDAAAWERLKASIDWTAGRAEPGEAIFRARA